MFTTSPNIRQLTFRRSRTAIGVCTFVATIASSTIAASTIAPSTLGAQQVVRQIDSVLVKESEGTYLSRIGTMAVGPKGDVFVSDLAEGRILQIASTGNIVGSFARKGNGPGELSSPSATTFVGDSLFVFDYSQKRISVFQVGTRKFIRSFTANFPPFTQISAVGSELIAQITELKTFTSVTVLSPSGAIVRTEGVTPEFVRNNPKFIETTNQSALTIRGTDAWSASEYSQSLYKWKRGTTSVEQELKLPVVSRRGVDEALFLRILRNPNDQALAVQFYNHSFPLALRFIATDLLALVTMDLKFEMPGPANPNGKFTGQHHVTLVDVKAKRVCPDAKLPIVEDPLPKVDLIGDVVVVLQQVSLKSGEAATALRRFKIDPKHCKWLPM